MGKRPTNATKGGKFMNPTDQARKEARRRELKKNKKQRILVRNAVLKGKRPQEVLEELQKIDDMEYNPVTPCPLNQKVMAEKRKKLMETWERLFQMYEKEAPDKYDELRKQWTGYQSRRMDVIRYYESVMAAKHVSVDAIPLPNMSMGELGEWDEENIPLPPSIQSKEMPKSSLKKPTEPRDVMKSKICPGVPPGAPPSIQDYEDISIPEKDNRKRKIRFGEEEEEDYLDNDEPEAPGTQRELPPPAKQQPTSAPKPSSLQMKMLEMAGQDVDQFMKEMEEVHRQKEKEREANLQKRLARLDKEPKPPGTDRDHRDHRDQRDHRDHRDHRDQRDHRDHRDHRDYRDRGGDDLALPVRPGVPPPGVGLPPGPPPGSHQQQSLQPVAPGVPPAGVRVPPGPPPGGPPGGPPAAPPGVPPQTRPLMPKPLGVLSAKPQLNKAEVKTDSVIASAPALRNLKSDVTRFVPTHLKVKRGADVKGGGGGGGAGGGGAVFRGGSKKKEGEEEEKMSMFTQQKGPLKEQKTKDDAYNEFMKEMKDLL